MADYPTPPVAVTGVPAGTAVTGYATASGPLALGTVAATPPVPTKLTSPTSYQIAGTLDLLYRPPTVGQLWPRGDLDAE